jgi:hypothetical protein
MPFANAANGGIARHLAKRFDVVREQQRLAPHARRRERRLGSGMAAADHDDLVFCSEHHDLIDLF